MILLLVGAFLAIVIAYAIIEAILKALISNYKPAPSPQVAELNKLGFIVRQDFRYIFLSDSGVAFTYGEEWVMLSTDQIVSAKSRKEITKWGKNSSVQIFLDIVTSDKRTYSVNFTPMMIFRSDNIFYDKVMDNFAAAEKAVNKLMSDSKSKPEEPRQKKEPINIAWYKP